MEANRTQDLTTAKSLGHIGFYGEFEYFTGPDGDLYRANVSWPVQVDGRRWGRWEAPAWMIESTMALVAQAFANHPQRNRPGELGGSRGGLDKTR